MICQFFPAEIFRKLKLCLISFNHVLGAGGDGVDALGYVGSVPLRALLQRMVFKLLQGAR